MRKSGTTGTQYLLESILDPAAYRPPGAEGEMPAQAAADLRDNDLRDLVAFLGSQGSQPDYREIASLEIPGRPTHAQVKVPTSLETLTRGQTLYREKGRCETCHPLTRFPGHDLLAPSLLEASRYTRDYLRQSILDTSASIAAGYENYAVLSQDGVVHGGRMLMNREDAIMLLEIAPSGELLPQWMPRVSIASLEKSETSAMPSFAETFSEAEVDSLVAFLLTLKS